MTSSRSSSLVLAALLVLGAAPARGESAKEAYSRGLTLYAGGKYADAADAFLAAYRLKPKPLILFNVGQAYRKQGALDQALTYYRRFLDEATPQERAPVEEEVRKYVKEIEAEQALKRSLVDKADTEEANKIEFAKPAPPTTQSPPPTQSPAPTQSPPPTTAPTTNALTATPPAAPPEKTPVYKKWWLWTAVAVVVAGAAVGVGVGVGTRSTDPSTALGTRQPAF